MTFGTSLYTRHFVRIFRAIMTAKVIEATSQLPYFLISQQNKGSLLFSSAVLSQ